MRRFAVVGHRAMSKGKLPLNDLASGAGRMDVLIRALMAGLMTSHGLRKDSVVVLHLLGGPGPPRRIKFDGETLKGLHADERSIAGTIGKVIATPSPTNRALATHYSRHQPQRWRIGLHTAGVARWNHGASRCGGASFVDAKSNAA